MSGRKVELDEVIVPAPLLESSVGFRSNFKKIPTHTQDHGDA